MLNKPKNYEEARKILEDSVDDNFTKRTVNISRLKLLFTTAVGAALLSAIQILGNEPMLTAIGIPAVAAMCAPGLLPYYVNKNTLKRIKNGEFFETKTDENVIEIANTYVDEYNKYEERKNKKEGKAK